MGKFSTNTPLPGVGHASAQAPKKQTVTTAIKQAKSKMAGKPNLASVAKGIAGRKSMLIGTGHKPKQGGSGPMSGNV